ncbi:hypothetical protein Efla_007511 [Eimeria flavescens]
MESDLAVPLAQHTAELKAERLRLMHQLSLLASQTRQLYDSLHPGGLSASPQPRAMKQRLAAELLNAPLVIVAKTADDDKRKEANKVDAKAPVLPSTRKERPRSKRSSEEEVANDSRLASVDMLREYRSSKARDALKEEARTLAMMSPEERLEYGESCISD